MEKVTWKDSAPITLAMITTFGFFFCIFWMLKWGFPAENKDALNSLLGVLTTIFTLQMNFFFGSTSSSKNKDEVIGNIAQAIPAAGVSGTKGGPGGDGGKGGKGGEAIVDNKET